MTIPSTHPAPVKDLLIVDDDQHFLNAVAKGLSAAMPSVHVVTASNGREALNRLKVAVFDLIVTDLKMPVMDGFQLLEHVHARTPNTGLVAMSMYDGPDIRERLARTGISRFLAKPFDLPALVNVIRSGVAHAGAGIAAAPPRVVQHVLIMDDDAAVREVTEVMLQYRGYTVRQASNGAEAVRRFTDALHFGSPFDAVILDLYAGRGMDGAEVAWLIRQSDPHVRIILATGWIEDPVFTNYAAYGFDAALGKPYDPLQLEKALRAVAEREWSDGSGR